MTAYYNEFDPYAAEWLRNLIAGGLIPAGDVDTRSIEDVKPDDLVGYAQCHFFAGIGGWPLALRLAGVSDDTPVWTGSCPCQPFSAAGKGKGTADERHLWPHFHYLIEQCQPHLVFGEQVASKAGRDWLAIVQTDLEALGFAVGAADLCAAGVGAPHIRQRLWWVAHSELPSTERHGQHGGEVQAAGLLRDGPSDSGVTGRLANSSGDGWGTGWNRNHAEYVGPVTNANGGHGGLDNPGRIKSGGRRIAGEESGERSEPGSGSGVAGSDVGLADTKSGRQSVGGHAGLKGSGRHSDGLDQRNEANPHHIDWQDSDWLLCRDGKFRPVEPGTFPLAHGIPGRVGRLRAYGNAIVPEVAAQFIGALMELRQGALDLA